MSSPRQPDPVFLFMSVIGREDGLEAILPELEAGFGPLRPLGRALAFDYTDYYASEMGADLSRYFVGFERLIAPETLPDVKRATNTLEDLWSENGRRRLNLDPGYIAAAHVILATGKGFAHRPYLRDGIYADLTLIYAKGGFSPLPWTYPDYRSDEVVALMTEARQAYLEILKQKRTQA